MQDEGYANIQLALDSLACDVDQSKDTWLEAQSISKKMDKLETVILTLFWNDVLRLTVSMASLKLSKNRT